MVEVWDRILMVQNLALSPRENSDAWMKMASLCRKNGKMNSSRNILCNLLWMTRQVCWSQGEVFFLYVLKCIHNREQREKSVAFMWTDLWMLTKYLILNI